MNSQLYNHESMLTESIKHFLTQHHNGNPNFSSFESIFFRLIQTMLDPPLEITWFYSAVTFHAAKSAPLTNTNRVLVAKDLLNLLISCSNLSSPSKKIALLAPVVYEFYNIVNDCSSREDSSFVKMEVEKLVDKMYSYVMVAAGLYDGVSGVGETDKGMVCFEELVGVWTVDRGGGKGGFEEDLRVFFPILRGGGWKGKKGRWKVRELVGMVLCEVFFLRMYLSFGSGLCAVELVKESVVQSVKGFRDFHFLDTLFQMLLKPSLPIAALLSSKAAIIIQTALYDAVMMEYLFYSGSRVQSDDAHAKKLALQWVFVADSAIQFARANNDQTRAASYLEAFVGSYCVSGLIEWATIQAGMAEHILGPDTSTPEAFIRWLLLLEYQGLIVFDGIASDLQVKASAFQSTEVEVSLGLQLGNENLHQGTRRVTESVRKRKGSDNYLEESEGKHAKFDDPGSCSRSKSSVVIIDSGENDDDMCMG